MNRTYKQPVAKILPWMFSKAKRELFNRYCSLAKGYFEYGCGGSTVAASTILSCTNINSVESDINWIIKVKDSIPTVQFTHIDIGPISEFGYPATEINHSVWHTYSQAWTTLDHQADLVLIDGRFRVACALWLCLHPKAVKWAFFDDFRNRPHYFCILEFIDILEGADDLIVFKPKKDFNIEKCTKLYEEYKNNPK